MALPQGHCPTFSRSRGAEIPAPLCFRPVSLPFRGCAWPRLTVTAEPSVGQSFRGLSPQLRLRSCVLVVEFRVQNVVILVVSSGWCSLPPIPGSAACWPGCTVRSLCLCSIH